MPVCHKGDPTNQPGALPRQYPSPPRDVQQLVLMFCFKDPCAALPLWTPLFLVTFDDGLNNLSRVSVSSVDGRLTIVQLV